MPDMEVSMSLQLCADELGDHVVRQRMANGGPRSFNGDTKAFIRRLRQETWLALGSFFTDKRFYAGGPIPARYLYSQDNFRRVVSTPFHAGIDLCYDLFQECEIQKPICFDDEAIDWDIYYMLNLLADARRCRVPIHLQPGVMVVYFKICHGLRVPDVKLDITHMIT